VVKPLTVLTSPKVKWAWNIAQQQAFDNIKQKVGLLLVRCQGKELIYQMEECKKNKFNLERYQESRKKIWP